MTIFDKYQKILLSIEPPRKSEFFKLKIQIQHYISNNLVDFMIFQIRHKITILTGFNFMKLLLSNDVLNSIALKFKLNAF